MSHGMLAVRGSYARILKCAREIVATDKGKSDGEEVDDEGKVIDEKEQKKAAKDAGLVMRAAFVRVRKRL